jgi:hypothetical protein
MPALSTPLKRKTATIRRSRANDLDLYQQMGAEVAAAIEAATAPLVARIQELESRAKAWRFLGAWSEGMIAVPGNFCSHSGSTWACVEQTSQRPGTPNSGWLLSAKSGRDGRSK